jgi:diguanylate cyclase (GGDEF)-like protein
MQVDLDSVCRRATAETPTTLLLFDLNGFKRYNDSFGHPAGDELLVRLGHRLGEAAGEDGTAYRIGGDEFCLLASGPEEGVEALTLRAARALCASDRGVEVRSSWGAVTIPREAATPSGALQLADLRMYAQKEAQRIANGSAEAGAAVKVQRWPQTSTGA